MSQTAADRIIGRGVAHAYTDRAARIERDAAARALERMPLTVAILRHYAAIARRAAVADRDDPDEADPRDRECSICGRVVCLARP